MHSKGKIIIGTSGWSYEDWRGKFYPQDLPQRLWLKFYTKHFAAIEMNATFYRSFKKKNYLKWRNEVPKNFRYIVKTHRYITHRKLLLNCKSSIKKFCKSTQWLESKLGLILLQLPPRMPYDPERLKSALLQFDDPKKVAVEFRNTKWLTNEVKEMLQELGSVFCNCDSPQSQLNNWVTSKIVYIRLHGRKRWYAYKYSQKELNEIARFAEKMATQAKRIYIFFNNDYAAYAIENAIYLQKLLNN